MWCGAVGMAPLYSASASPGPSSAMRRVGTLTISHRKNFKIEKCNPPVARGELVMTRPNPVRRGKSRPQVSSPRRSGRVDGFGPPTAAASSEAACARAAPKPRESKCRGIQESLIEAFEDQPGRWFAYFSRLDGQNIAGTESNSLRTPSARYSKEDAIEFAKEAIDGLPDS